MFSELGSLGFELRLKVRILLIAAQTDVIKFLQQFFGF
jgi:hypothetical protein